MGLCSVATEISAFSIPKFLGHNSIKKVGEYGKTPAETDLVRQFSANPHNLGFILGITEACVKILKKSSASQSACLYRVNVVFYY